MEFVKIGIIAVLGVMLAIQFKGVKQEFGIYIGLVICLFLFFCAASYMEQLKEQLFGIRKFLASNDRYFSLLLKIVGITWLCEFVSGICKDSGYTAIASQMELLGKIAILFAGMPVFLALMETIAGFAK